MNVLITGASSGIGKYLSEKFEAEGHTVIKIAKDMPDGENNYLCDLSVESQLNDTIDKIKNKYERIDILINNAGYGIFSESSQVSEADTRNIFEVNFFSAIKLTNGLLPLMREGSRIVAISSCSAILSLPYRTLYSASKAALKLYFLGYSGEVQNKGIKVIVIAPGEIKTTFTKNRKIYENSNNSENYANSRKYLEKRKNKRISLEKAGDKLYKIINKKNPSKYYIIGFTYKLINVARNIFGINFLQKIINRKFT